jgi:hypothetical protein
MTFKDIVRFMIAGLLTFYNLKTFKEAVRLATDIAC